MFPGVDLKISPNGLYKLVSAQASPATLHTDDRYLTPQPVPDDASTDSRELVIQAQLHELAGALGAPKPNIEMPVNVGVRR